MKILAISGSLRPASINTALLKAVAQRSPPEIHVSVYSGLDHLPSFNSSIRVLPWIVTDFQSRVAASDALIIASPEYGCGISGTLKTALDWLVENNYLADKPLAVINGSERGYHAERSLREELNSMSVNIVEEASFTFSVAGAGMGDLNAAYAPQTVRKIDRCLLALKRNSTSLARRRFLANSAVLLGYHRVPSKRDP